MALLSILPFVHDTLRRHVVSGSVAVDGTAGNGNDTLLLAQLVGDKGRVYAFDIQTIALHNTAERLRQNYVLHRAELIQSGHENLAQFVSQPISAAVFNFGYLPRGDHAITTLPETSLTALNAACQLLMTGGIVCAVLYHGHEQGKAETAEILQWASTLTQPNFRVLRYEFINQKNCPPIGLIIEKIK